MISTSSTDEHILEQLGKRIESSRIDHNLTQAQLSREAGISRPTVQRLEGGRDVNLSSLLRVLRVLGLLDRIDLLLPEPAIRPMDALKAKGKRRKRVRASKPKKKKPWKWGDDS